MPARRGDKVAAKLLLHRQLFDLAGQALGRAGQVDDAIAMFERALTQDPHAINSRIGLIVTLHLARRYGKAVPHLKELIKLFPTNLRILQLSIQARQLGDTPCLAAACYSLPSPVTLSLGYAENRCL